MFYFSKILVALPDHLLLLPHKPLHHLIKTFCYLLQGHFQSGLHQLFSIHQSLLSKLKELDPFPQFELAEPDLLDAELEGLLDAPDVVVGVGLVSKALQAKELIIAIAAGEHVLFAQVVLAMLSRLFIELRG